MKTKLALRLARRAAPAVAGVLMAGTAWSAPFTLSIVSNAAWRTFGSNLTSVSEAEALVAGWTTVGFDDSGWSQARAGYPGPDPTTIIAGTTASSIWHDPAGTSNGTNGVLQAFFRYTFNLSLAGSGAVFGQALVNVDDDYQMYVNGTLVESNTDGGFADRVQSVDFSSQLIDGTNVIAIHAVDGRWSGPFDRIAERLVFDGIVRTVPEPSALSLAAISILAGFARARRSPRT